MTNMKQPRMSGQCTMGTEQSKPTIEPVNTPCDCPICMDPINKETGVSTLTCGHSYHLSCISKWLQDGTKTCPMCRGIPTKYEVSTPKNEVADSVSLDVSWVQNGQGVWTRVIKVVSDPLVWRPGSGPQPHSLVQWLAGTG